jgi:hypothetical protein
MEKNNENLFLNSSRRYRVTILPNLSLCSFKSHWHKIIIIRHIHFFLRIVSFSNPTGQLCTHGRCSICPTAKERKTDWKCCQCSERVCQDHSIKTIQIKCNNCKEQSPRDKFHSHLCSQPYFLVLKYFKYFTQYKCRKNEKCEWKQRFDFNRAY